MRTTIQLDADVSAAIAELQKKSSLDVSGAVNSLIRRGLAARTKCQTFEQLTQALGLRVDVSKAAEALDVLEGPTFGDSDQITTNPRASAKPLIPADAWGFVEQWWDCDRTWIPNPTARDVFSDVATRPDRSR